jgi:hypothetical protein
MLDASGSKGEYLKKRFDPKRGPNLARQPVTENHGTRRDNPRPAYAVTTVLSIP